MAANTGKLAGRTLFITGASRGIGKAIALKAARDGANIVIAAKTTQAHPKLPGTIYTAAKEVEEAGGKCLPCIVDIRHEESVNKAVEETIKKFGGIDILINNASAISLTSTLETPMKRYDLMNQVNSRGTYLCSRACLPHLKKGTNPHILNLSPPLNLSPMWFKGHVAYTMAKYGMSMCVLGMAEEFKPDGVAVNALWPRTAIYTSAMAMLGGGEEIAKQCRKPEIISDSAYLMLCKDSRSYTGNFAIDDEVLRDAGITDLEQYACVPGSKLLPDFFLDNNPNELQQQILDEGATPTLKATADTGTGDGVTDKSFKTIEGILNTDMVKEVNGIFQFNITGDEEGIWYIDLKNGSGSVGKGEPPEAAQVTMTLKSINFDKLFKGKLSPTSAFMSGKLKIKGDTALALKLDKIMGKARAKL